MSADDLISQALSRGATYNTDWDKTFAIEGVSARAGVLSMADLQSTVSQAAEKSRSYLTSNPQAALYYALEAKTFQQAIDSNVYAPTAAISEQRRGALMQAIGDMSGVTGVQGATTFPVASPEPRPPHPDAADQSKGPNLGGEDALAGSPPGPPAPPAQGGSLGGLILIAGVLLGATLLISRRKK